MSLESDSWFMRRTDRKPYDGIKNDERVKVWCELGKLTTGDGARREGLLCLKNRVIASLLPSWKDISN